VKDKILKNNTKTELLRMVHIKPTSRILPSDQRRPTEKPFKRIMLLPPIVTSRPYYVDCSSKELWPLLLSKN